MEKNMQTIHKNERQAQKWTTTTNTPGNYSEAPETPSRQQQNQTHNERNDQPLSAGENMGFAHFMEHLESHGLIDTYAAFHLLSCRSFWCFSAVSCSVCCYGSFFYLGLVIYVYVCVHEASGRVTNHLLKYKIIPYLMMKWCVPFQIDTGRGLLCISELSWTKLYFWCKLTFVCIVRWICLQIFTVKYWSWKRSVNPFRIVSIVFQTKEPTVIMNPWPWLTKAVRI